MSDDELLAIYGSIRKLAESMSAREAALDQRTAALNTAIAQLEKMPFTLGKQTSQYIGMGVREAIQQDFSPPIKEVFQPPIAELKGVLSNAREAIQEVSRYAKYQTWGWLFSIFVIGFVVGVLVSQFSLGSKIDGLRDQITATQQTAPPAAPIETKPSTGSKDKNHHGR